MGCCKVYFEVNGKCGGLEEQIEGERRQHVEMTGDQQKQDHRFHRLGPNPQNIQEVAVFLPTVYLVSAPLADWLDRKRSRKAVSVPESVQSVAQA